MTRMEQAGGWLAAALMLVAVALGVLFGLERHAEKMACHAACAKAGYGMLSRSDGQCVCDRTTLAVTP